MSAGNDLDEDGPVGAEDAPQSSGHHTARHQEEESVAGGPRFNPPVYSQRYALVQEVLKKHGVESVVDFGCAECKIVHFLKNVDSVQRIALVDADRGVLAAGSSIVRPSPFEFLIPRQTPLSVAVFHGSAGDLDGRLVGYQAASLVELIEHLEPDVLMQVTHNVFGRLRPSVVIVTTPNADFNVLFPNFTGFRHWDHKFEWTREEFQQWSEDVCKKHGYAVRYTGVGDPPADMSHVGFCSQAAIFTEISGKAGERTEEKVYDPVIEVVYPYDKRTPAERLANEVDYMVNSSCAQDPYRSEDDTQAVIPVSLVCDCVLQRLSSRKEEKWTKEDVMQYLQSKYTLMDDDANVVVELVEDDSSLDRFEDIWDRGEGVLPPEEQWVVNEEEDWG